MCLDIHAKFHGDRPLRGPRSERGGQIDPPPPQLSKNLLSKSPVKIGLNYKRKLQEDQAVIVKTGSILLLLKHRLERRYTTGMVGVSWGKPLILFNAHTKLAFFASLVRAIVSAAVHGTDPVSAHTFTGRSTSKCLNIFFFFKCTDRNFYKLVHGERTHEPS